MTDQERKPSNWRDNVRFAAAIVNSLAIPLLTVAATVVGLYATNTMKEREIAIARMTAIDDRARIDVVRADQKSRDVLNRFLRRRQTNALQRSTAQCGQTLQR